MTDPIPPTRRPGCPCCFRRASGRLWLGLLVVAMAVAAIVGLLLHMLRLKDLTWVGIQQSSILRVCSDPSWPPFEVHNPGTGEIEGFDADLARLLAARLAPGVRAEFVTVGFDSLYDALRASRCDAVISALPYDPTRVGYVRYSVAYFNAGLVLVTRQGDPGITGLDDLEGRSVGVEWGFVPEGSGRQRLILQRLGLRRYDTAGDVLRALQSGELDAAIVDRISALTFLGQCSGLQISGEPISDVNYVIPVRPDANVLLEEINRVLLEMRTDGTLQRLEDRWF